MTATQRSAGCLRLRLANRRAVFPDAGRLRRRRFPAAADLAAVADAAAQADCQRGDQFILRHLMPAVDPMLLRQSGQLLAGQGSEGRKSHGKLSPAFDARSAGQNGRYRSAETAEFSQGETHLRDRRYLRIPDLKK